MARIAARQTTVGVVGLGYVGRGVVELARRAGFPVIGLDTDAEAVAQCRAAAAAQGRAMAGKLTPSLAVDTDVSVLAGAEIFVICVPTPLGDDGRPDLSALRAAAGAVGAVLQPGQLVVLESTVWPGATRQVLLPELLAAVAGRSPDCRPSPGSDLFVAHAPERVDPGRRDPPPASIPRLVGGLDEASREAAVAFVSALVKRVVPCASAEVAEAAKLFENLFRSVNVALVQELELLAEALGVDVHEILDAAATKPFGFLPFRPGAGAGGHCLPVAPAYYLEALRRARGGAAAGAASGSDGSESGDGVAGAAAVGGRLAAAAQTVNAEVPARVLDRARRLLAVRRSRGDSAGRSGNRDGGRGNDPLSGARVLLVGMGYKPGSRDPQGSPGVALLRLLHAAGAAVTWFDPLVVELPASLAAGLPAELRRRCAEREPAADGFDVVIAPHGRPVVRAGSA